MADQRTEGSGDQFGVTGMPAGDKEAAGVIEVQGFGVTSTASEEEKAAAYDLSPTGIQTRLVKSGPCATDIRHI